jgi:hypothetical protein
MSATIMLHLKYFKLEREHPNNGFALTLKAPGNSLTIFCPNKTFWYAIRSEIEKSEDYTYITDEGENVYDEELADNLASLVFLPREK